jgi:hypothetical protein
MIITLIDGSSVDTADIMFDSGDYSFTLSTAGGTRDVTLQIREADKKANWPSWDVTTWNNIYYTKYLYPVSHGGTTAPAVGSTSTWDNFWGQITTDPLGAPLASLDTVVSNTVKDAFGSSSVWSAILIVGAIFAGYIMLSPERMKEYRKPSRRK